ncbi:MAG: GNAT family acetyltransferase [Peptococcaceae bacterium]|nr:GNAT family acetyltransferase [Peptococcaceae bacterium]
MELEHGNKIIFDMKKLKTTIPFFSLNDLKHFKEVRFEEKSIYWEQAGKEKPNVFPVRLTLDNILFMLRD